VGPRASLDAVVKKKKKNSQPLLGLEPPIIQPVAYATYEKLKIKEGA
jgi:hypothetical protein